MWTSRKSVLLVDEKAITLIKVESNKAKSETTVYKDKHLFNPVKEFFQLVSTATVATETMVHVKPANTANTAVYETSKSILI